MTTNSLPDLSKWHEVPADADIPAGVLFVVLRKDGSWVTRVTQFTGPFTSAARAHHVEDGCRYFTADPIPAPRPAPPTEPGTVLVDVTTDSGTLISRLHYAPTSTCDPCPWLRLATPGAAGSWFRTSELVSWTMADVVPRTDPEVIPAWEVELLAKGAPDPLDENDHRPRVRNGQALTRRECGRWHASGAGDLCPLGGHSPDALTTFTLASWNRCGPVRFAGEVQS